MKDKPARHQRTELLAPGETGWELWVGDEKGGFTRSRTFDSETGAFTTGSAHCVLAVPAAWVWVLPAWLNGSGAAQLLPMAALYLERVGIRISSEEHPMQTAVLAENKGATLVRMVAHREHGASLSDLSRLPDLCVLAPSLYAIPPDTLAIWRELDRLVMAVTQGEQLVYYSPLSAPELDEHAVIEIINVTIQLGFQQAVGQLSGIILWTEEGDSLSISRLTGLNIKRLPKPAPKILPSCQPTVAPQDIAAAATLQAERRKKRLIALALGAVAALAVAAVAGLTFFASRTRTSLLDEIATLTPSAAGVDRHKRAWDEVSAAVDPARSPMELLLHCLAPPSSAAVSLTHFEVTPESVVIRGRTATPAQALQYVQETRSLPALAALGLDATPPAIASDNTASFELKGTLKP